MIPKKIEQAFNAQIKEEMASSYLYLAMAAYFDKKNWPGFASWMKKQAMEEHVHAMKLYDHIIERGGSVILQALPKPAESWANHTVVFEAALKHEKFITSKIHSLVELSASEKDHPSKSLLQWFVDEQVEEESTVDNILDQLKKVNGSVGALFYMDAHLGKRA